MFITATGAKVLDDRKAQGQVRQRSVIQKWGKGTGQQAGSGAGRVDEAGGLRDRTGKGQNQEGTKKRDWKKQALSHKNTG